MGGAEPGGHEVNTNADGGAALPRESRGEVTKPHGLKTYGKEMNKLRAIPRQELRRATRAAKERRSSGSTTR